jgi:hypothetical protein
MSSFEYILSKKEDIVRDFVVSNDTGDSNETLESSGSATNYKDVNIQETENGEGEGEGEGREDGVREDCDREDGDETTPELKFADVTDDKDSIIYDLLHFIDDIYVYGRTVIENNYFNFSSNADFSLVYPNIYIGNYSTSTNQELLVNLGITHIITVIPKFNPPSSFDKKFEYLFIPAYDDQCQDISNNFDKSNDFITNLLNNGGKVLIHCMVGRSRSVTIFIAFLIHIIKGNYNQENLKLDSENDIYNMIEYNKMITYKNNSQNSRQLGNENGENGDLNKEDKITRIQHTKPVLGKKEEEFIFYKKRKMINEIEELKKKYKLFQKEIEIYNGDCASTDSESINNLKNKFTSTFVNKIIDYVVKYRSIANPNPYFIKQLSDYLYS